MAYYVVGAIIVLWFIGSIYRHLRRRNKVIHAVEGKCTGCKRCLTNIRKCKRNVLDLVSDKNGKHIAVKYPDKCTACGDCISVCKFYALELVQKEQHR